MLYDKFFLSEAGTINFPIVLMETQAIGKANNDAVLFFLFKITATEQVVCGKRRVSKRITRHNSTFLSFLQFPYPVSHMHVESNVIDMITLRSEIERELSKVAQREKVGFGCDKH